MCLSAEANFVAAGGRRHCRVGAATLHHVDQSRAVLFASMPMLFALHQCLAWSKWPKRTRHWIRAPFFPFLRYEQGKLALLMPLAVLMDPAGWRRRAVGGVTIVGAAVCACATYGAARYPRRALIDHLSIASRYPLTDGGWLAAGDSLRRAVLYFYLHTGSSHGPKSLMLSAYRGHDAQGLFVRFPTVPP